LSKSQGNLSRQIKFIAPRFWVCRMCRRRGQWCLLSGIIECRWNASNCVL